MVAGVCAVLRVGSARLVLGDYSMFYLKSFKLSLNVSRMFPFISNICKKKFELCLPVSVNMNICISMNS